MIVDTSALMAIILGEQDAEWVLARMTDVRERAVSAGSLVEAAIVAKAKGGPEAADDLQALLADLECAVLPFDEEQAVVAAQAWRRSGRAVTPPVRTAVTASRVRRRR